MKRAGRLRTPPAGNEFYMTRRQIGEALEYPNGNEQIKVIHSRHRDRLDPLSTVVNLSNVEGDRYVTRETYVYTLRGAMEICRFSRQPNADGVAIFVPFFRVLADYSCPNLY